MTFCSDAVKCPHQTLFYHRSDICLLAVDDCRSQSTHHAACHQDVVPNCIHNVWLRQRCSRNNLRRVDEAAASQLLLRVLESKKFVVASAVKAINDSVGCSRLPLHVDHNIRPHTRTDDEQLITQLVRFDRVAIKTDYDGVLPFEL